MRAVCLNILCTVLGLWENKIRCVELQAHSLLLSLNSKTMLGLNLIWASHPWYLPKLCCSRDHAWPCAQSSPVCRLNCPVTTTSRGHCPLMPPPGQALTLTLFSKLGHKGTAPLWGGDYCTQNARIAHTYIYNGVFIWFEASWICLYHGQEAALEPMLDHVGLVQQIPHINYFKKKLF